MKIEKQGKRDEVNRSPEARRGAWRGEGGGACTVAFQMPSALRLEVREMRDRAVAMGHRALRRNRRGGAG